MLNGSFMFEHNMFYHNVLHTYKDSDANEAKVLSEGKRAVLASVIETQDIK